jgi:hypothetical protein
MTLRIFSWRSRERGDHSERQIRTQLRELDGTLLLFLRSLRQISIDIDNGTDTRHGKCLNNLKREDSHKYGGEMIQIRKD